MPIHLRKYSDVSQAYSMNNKQYRAFTFNELVFLRNYSVHVWLGFLASEN